MTYDKKIPIGISDYVTEHFKEDFLFKVKDVRKIKDHLLYTIEVSKDDYTHTLKFNENGRLVNEEDEQAFPTDIHEEPTFENIPD